MRRPTKKPRVESRGQGSMPSPKRAVEGAIARSRDTLVRATRFEPAGRTIRNKNGPAVLAGPKFAMLRRSALAAGGAGRDHRCRRCLHCCALLPRAGTTLGARLGGALALAARVPYSTSKVRPHFVASSGATARRAWWRSSKGWSQNKRTARPSVAPFSFQTDHGGWLPFGHHPFQVSPAQYPRPVCSRNVMLGPGFQVSS
jgi:hypothetical protein